VREEARRSFSHALSLWKSAGPWMIGRLSGLAVVVSWLSVAGARREAGVARGVRVRVHEQRANADGIAVVCNVFRTLVGLLGLFGEQSRNRAQTSSEPAPGAIRTCFVARRSPCDIAGTRLQSLQQYRCWPLCGAGLPIASDFTRGIRREGRGLRWARVREEKSSLTLTSQPTYDGRKVVLVAMQEEGERIHRFVQAFEKLYGRKPRPEDAVGNFTVQVAQDMEMSVGGARYYIRAATEGKSRRARHE
jgi:hypothetical protein